MSPLRSSHSVHPFWSVLLLAAICSLPISARAADPSPAPALTKAAAGGPAWNTLTPTQQRALAPLKRDWVGIENDRKQKWLEVASRFSSMSPEERQRVQDRMSEWARLTPEERTRARMQFQEARQLSPEDRQARWQAYQALPEQERRDLADRARPLNAKPPAKAPARNVVEAAADDRRTSTPAAPRARAVTPTVVQAGPGATTTLMSSPAKPPAHHQPGLPKIAATDGFVDPSTLLPQRGAQGAAVQRSPDAPAAAPK